MKIFVAGATGVLGRRLIYHFRNRGHSVIGLVRSQKGQEIVNSLGGESCWGDLFDADSLANAADGSDVVIHAATSIPVKSRISPKDFKMNDLIRRDGTRALTYCAAKIGAKLYIQQSIVWVARPSDGSFFDEDSPANPSPLIQSALDGEKIAREAGEHFDFTVSVLRCGWFYGADAAHTRVLGDGLLKRRFPIIGSGEAILSCLHLDDAASAFVKASETNQTGIWHVVDEQPVTVAELLTYFAELLGAPTPRRVPVWLARLLAGRHAVDFFTSSTRTSNARFCREFGWTPRYPSYREGLGQVVELWKSEGFLDMRG
ncbi:MAG TPA: NAD(P)-dependent oxidoreductase [Thermodesulfobacteriota bacterium]|nr:NAD(P)-dependent oxidoreductase [Thermodesulfobacteriota bacterium]